MTRYGIVVAVWSSVIGFATSAMAQEQLIPPQADPGAAAVEQEGIDVLMRGPVHEAFAEPVAVDASETSPVVSEEPPEPVNEIPPDARPEDDSAAWIPGYWNWDDVEKRYLWVSGVWRIPPSGERWVPGYWTQADNGYRRVNGFWSSVDEQQVQYLPAPPETLEVGPNTEPPSENHFWIPGCWIYSNQDYRWRPGYWYTNSLNWMWVPDRYVWTPRGHVFCSGYWDYADWSRRGVLFAPVYFNRPLYRSAGYYFTPRVLINVGFLTNHFFYRPGYRQYYFGDYYGSSFANLGFHHWYSWNRWGRGWDPYYNHFRRDYGRDNPRWHDQWRERYEHYARNDRDRPPHTWKDVREWERRDGDRRRDWDRERFVGTTVEDALRRGDGRSRYNLTRLDDKDRLRYRENSRELRELAQQRGRIEGREGREGRGLGQTARRDEGRGSFQLPDAEQFRRSASRDREERSRRIESALTREGQRPDRQQQFERLRQQELARGERGASDRLRTEPGGREFSGRERREGERQRGLSESTPRQFDSRRFENSQRTGGENERSVRERRSVGRVPLDDSPQVRPTPRTLQRERQIDSPSRGFDFRQQYDRSSGQSNFERSRRNLPQSNEFRPGERSVERNNPSFRFDNTPSRRSSEISPRESRSPSSNFQRRSFNPPSSSSPRQQLSRPQRSPRIEASPRGGNRFEGRSNAGSGRSVRSSGGGGDRGRSSGSSRGSQRSGGGGKGKRDKD